MFKKLERENILNDNITKVIIMLSLPIVFNTLITAIYNLIDAIFVSNIGEIEVTSIVFVGSIDNLFKGIPVGISAGATTLVARYIGSSEYEKAKKYAGNSISITIIIAMFLSFVSLFYSKNILHMFDATENIITASNMYFKINMFLSVILFFNLIYLAIKSAEGDTKKAMQVNFISIAIKIVLNFILIYIFNGGLISLCVSTFISGLVVTIYGVYDLFVKENSMKLTLKELKFDYKVLKFLFFVSIPVVIERMSVSFGFTAINSQVLSFGEDVLAAYGITNRIDSLSFGTVTAVGTGLSIVISQNLSFGNLERCKEAIKKTFVINIVFSTVLFLIVFSLRSFFAGLFTFGEESSTYQHTINALSIIGISVIPWSIFQVVIGLFTGMGKTKYNLYVSLARIYLFRLPLVWFFVNYLSSLGAYSIWYSVLISNVITALLSLVLYFKQGKNLSLYTIK